jgi:alpha-L-rhamnosidase
VIEPDFDIGVDHVAAHVGTPYGRLGVEWTRAGDAASVVVDVPFGVSARLVTAAGSVALPSGRSVHELGL